MTLYTQDNILNNMFILEQYFCLKYWRVTYYSYAWPHFSRFLVSTIFQGSHFVIELTILYQNYKDAHSLKKDGGHCSWVSKKQKSEGKWLRNNHGYVDSRKPHK